MNERILALNISPLRATPPSRQLFFFTAPGIQMARCSMSVAAHYPHLHPARDMATGDTIALTEIRLCPGIDIYGNFRKEASDFSLRPRSIAAQYGSLGDATSFCGRPEHTDYTFLPFAIKRLTDAEAAALDKAAADPNAAAATVDPNLGLLSVGLGAEASHPQTEARGDFTIIEAPDTVINLEERAAPRGTITVNAAMFDNNERWLKNAVIGRFAAAARKAIVGTQRAVVYVAIDFWKPTYEVDHIDFHQNTPEPEKKAPTKLQRGENGNTRPPKTVAAGSEPSPTGPSTSSPAEGEAKPGADKKRAASIRASERKR
jgi:hypothetical protein